MRNRFRLSLGVLILVATLLVVAGCGRPATGTMNEDGYIDTSVEQLIELMEQQDVTLINVHIPYAGDLPETDLSIPYNEISERLDELPAKNEPIVLYCRSGSMSTTAGIALADAGYTRIYELDGGMVAWVRAGHELIIE